MQSNFIPNPRLTARTLYVGRERQPVLILDDFLLDPDAMRRYAYGEAQFHASTTHYPGLMGKMPAPYVQAIGRTLGPLVASTFGVRLETAQVTNAFLGIVTTPPDRLGLVQRLPHVDTGDGGQLAFLHYFCDALHGGTAFFRHRATGYESLNDRQMREMGRMLERDLATHGPIPAKYADSSNRIFEQTGAVEAKFNRLVVYHSHVLHSGQMGRGATLSPDPRQGRLTANTFVRFQLASASTPRLVAIPA